jgi:putative flippase GtrA
MNSSPRSPLYDDRMASPPQPAARTIGRRTLSAWRDLRSPSSGVRGQGVRFAIAGGTVALVYIGTTIVLATIVGLPFQIALAIGLVVSLVVHFTLQRLFVWTHHEEFALSLQQQLGRYLVAAGTQYGVTAASTAVLPPFLGVSAPVVYLGTVAVVVSTNFLVFRHGIFHANPRTASTRPTDQA